MAILRSERDITNLVPGQWTDQNHATWIPSRSYFSFLEIFIRCNDLFAAEMSQGGQMRNKEDSGLHSPSFVKHLLKTASWQGHQGLKLDSPRFQRVEVSVQVICEPGSKTTSPTSPLMVQTCQRIKSFQCYYIFFKTETPSLLACCQLLFQSISIPLCSGIFGQVLRAWS